MKWTGMYLIGYVILIGGLLAALWKIGVGQHRCDMECDRHCNRNRYWHHARRRQ